MELHWEVIFPNYNDTGVFIQLAFHSLSLLTKEVRKPGLSIVTFDSGLPASHSPPPPSPLPGSSYPGSPLPLPPPSFSLL